MGLGPLGNARTALPPGIAGPLDPGFARELGRFGTGPITFGQGGFGTLPEQTNFGQGPVSLPNVGALANEELPTPPPSFGDRLRGLAGRIGEGVQSPLGQFATNLLAGSAPSLQPQSTLGNIGQAALATGQQNLQRRLLEAQIGRLSTQSARDLAEAAGAGATNSNVQSTFEGRNGNMHIVTRNGQVVDSGVAFNERLIPITRPDGSVVLVDPTRRGRTAGVDQTGAPSSGAIETEVISPEEAISGKAAAVRAGEQAKTDPELRRELPISITLARQNLQRQQGAIKALQEGRLNTGIFQGVGAGLSPEGQRFRQLSGLEVLESVSKATFGALSEGERQFLAGTVINLFDDEQVNIENLQRMTEITEKIIEMEEKEFQRIQGQEQSAISFSELPP